MNFVKKCTNILLTLAKRKTVSNKIFINKNYFALVKLFKSKLLFINKKSTYT